MPAELSDKKETKLPFPHGIEVELQVIRKDGSWMRGDEILNVFDKMVSGAKGLLDKRIRAAQVDSVRRKYKQSSQTEEGERGSRVVASYEDPQGSMKEYTLIGHDPNVTSLTWILEVATPPCTTLEELAWWVQTLVAITHESIPKESRAIVVSTGLNPTQEYLKNLSFGEHHHILSSSVDDKVRIAVYNMIRNFVPHLIAISVNSPFESKKPTDIVSIDGDGLTRAPKCKRSIRLLKNTTQMGPVNEFEFIPYINSTDKESFARHVNRSYARMVDVYPFTNYGTIEVRVFDTQLSVPRRVSLALILQALALRAKRMVEAGQEIPDVGARSLAANRESAVAAGLWAPFKPGVSEKNEEYMASYNGAVKEDGTYDKSHRSRFIGDAVVSMFHMIRQEMEELGLLDNPFMQPLFVSIFGSDFVTAKTTEADFQLEVYAKSDMNMMVLLNRLADITRECCTNWLYDPLEGTPHLPTWLCWWKGLEPEITTDSERTFGGQEAEFSISLKNSSDRDISDLTITYTVEDSDRHVVDQNVIPIAELEAGEVHVARVSFKTRSTASAYNVIAVVEAAGKRINKTATINIFWLRATVRPSATTQYADGRSHISFSGEIETNYPHVTKLTAKIAVVAQARGSLLGEVTRSIVVEIGEVFIFDESGIPPIIVPPDPSLSVERCFLRMTLSDQSGNEITTATSRPFYIGFIQRGPRVLLRTDAKTVHTPGDVLHGETELKGRGAGLPEGTRLTISFVTESGVSHSITDVSASRLLSESIRFEWRIPAIESDEISDRTGVVVASLRSGSGEISHAESARLRIADLGVRISILSLRAPEMSHVGGPISGWLRIRRSSDLGEPATLVMKFVFPDGEEHKAFTQAIKQNRNLSVAYGPILIPMPQASNADKVTLVAEVLYAGALMDRQAADIMLAGGPVDERLSLSFSGVSKFVIPDELVHAAVHLTNTSSERVNCHLSLVLESIAETENLLDQQVELGPEQTRAFGVPVRIPLTAEMSTAELKAVASCEEGTYEAKHVFKVKAIDKPLFFIDFSARNERGEDIHGLVPRESPVDIGVRLRCPREDVEGLTLAVRVLSKRDVVKEFMIPVTGSESADFKRTLSWITPTVEVVTGYYIDALLLLGGTPLPSRSIDVVRKQITVY